MDTTHIINSLDVGHGALFCKLHPDAVIPEYKTEKSACCDLYLCRSVHIKPWETTLVPLGLIAVPPQGSHWEIYLRSSTPIKYPGLHLANGTGIIDEDYQGPNDELALLLENESNEIIELPKHSRIAQMKLEINVRPATIEEIAYEQLGQRQSRGGFGSTDE